MAEFTEWDSFYVIIASAAGALIGLQFVVMTLIAEKPPKDAERAGAAFATPTIVHFSASLLVSALMRAPWPAIVFPAVLFGHPCLPQLFPGPGELLLRLPLWLL